MFLHFVPAGRVVWSQMFIKKVGRTALEYKTAVKRLHVLFGNFAEFIILQNGYAKTFVVYKPSYECIPLEIRQRLAVGQEEYEMYNTHW